MSSVWSAKHGGKQRGGKAAAHLQRHHAALTAASGNGTELILAHCLFMRLAIGWRDLHSTSHRFDRDRWKNGSGGFVEAKMRRCAQTKSCFNSDDCLRYCRTSRGKSSSLAKRVSALRR